MTKGSRHDRLLVLIALVVIVIVGVAFWLIRTGQLSIFAESPEPTSQVTVETPEPVKQPVVLFSSIRLAGESMAQTGLHAIAFGSSANNKKVTTYRVIGTPTDATIYIDNSPVCTETPCDIHVLNPEDANIEIRKGQASNVTALKSYNAKETIFLVLGK